MSDFDVYELGPNTLVVHKATGYAALKPSKRDARTCMEDLLTAIDSACEAVDENARMREAFTGIVDAAQKGGDFTLRLSGCEWCGEMWPRTEGQTKEVTLEAARYHLSNCEKHPLKQELARVMPVVEAAERWADDETESEAADVELGAAIVAMREGAK